LQPLPPNKTVVLDLSTKVTEGNEKGQVDSETNQGKV
jgi:hypothetical protein